MPHTNRHPRPSSAWCRAAGLCGFALVLAAADAPPPATSAAPPPEKLNATAITVETPTPSGILGEDVRAPDGKVIGRIIDVLVGKAGQPRAAVVDFGGFLGVGDRKIAVDWHNFNFAGKDKVTLELNADQLRAAPDYKPDAGSLKMLSKAPATPAPVLATPGAGKP